MEKALCTKAVTEITGLSARSLRRWSHLLKILPTFPLHSQNEWSQADVDRLIEARRAYILKKGKQRKKIHENAPIT
jgi:uncharacterized protein YdaU (DUF1376 family)